MDFITGIGQTVIGYGLPFLFVLTIVVFFHELGHFLVARWCGVKVMAFSVGFGPEIVGFDDRHGTRWKISAVPLGGYVKFSGDENAASMPDRDAAAQMDEEEFRSSFAGKPVWQRAAVVAAGPIANFILAIVIFAMLFALYGRAITKPRVDTIQPASAAAEAGFEPGDVILRINDSDIASFADIQRIVSVSAGEPLDILVEREGAEVALVATPKLREITDQFGNVQRVGLLGLSQQSRPEDRELVRYSIPAAVAEGAKETWFVVARTLGYLGGVVTGREPADQLGGPIRVAQFSGQVATLGIGALLNLAAVLSVSIGLINLMPVPMLDGGHLVFYAFEAIRGKPLPERVQDVGFRIGIALVLMLMMFATWNDVAHLAGG